MKTEQEENSIRPKSGLLIPFYVFTGVYVGTAYGIFPYYLDETIESQNLTKLAIVLTFVGIGKSAAAASHGKFAQIIGDVPVLILALTYFVSA